MRKSAKQISETDLYRPLYDYLTAQGYTVRGEVNHCDVAALKGDELIVVEMKRALNISLLAQAVQRQKITDSVYVAVPRPSNKWKWMKQSRDIQTVLRRLEIGLILVSPNGSKTPVEIIFHPAPHDRRKQKSAQRAVLHEIEHRSADHNEGGSCRRKLVTAYRENAIHIACCLADRGAMSPRELRSLGTGDKTFSILYNNVYSWFDRVDRGLYSINARGKTELESYPELVEHYRIQVSGDSEE